MLWRWLAIIGILVLAVGIFIMRPAANSQSKNYDDEMAAISTLPALKDFGSDKCVPCKMMAPILEELKTEYFGKFTVEFFDIWKDSAAGTKHGIQVIPTQIFFAADGTELFRHEGFYSKEDILLKWQDLGIKI